VAFLGTPRAGITVVTWKYPNTAVCSDRSKPFCSDSPISHRFLVETNMDTFSWSDSLRALTASCLACLRSKNERSDLEDLLVDSGSATTADAETLSLHSNPGALAQRRRRSRFGKNIRLFGWDLFGRRQPIRLPDDDDDEEDDDEAEAEREEREGGGGHRGQDSRKRKSRRRRSPPPTISSSTLDSDAALLDPAAIASHAEEEAARAARRAHRRERKERKRAGLTLALEHAAVLDGDCEFEGFPGSGGSQRRTATSASAAGSVPSHVRVGGANVPYRDDDDNEDVDEDLEEEGDFGAGTYARRAPVSSDSGRGSDSRSRTSTSLSGPQSAHSGQPYNHHYVSQQQQQQQQQQPGARPTMHAPPPPPPVRRKKKDKSSRSSSSSKRSRSSPSASQSPSIASPVAQQFSDTIGAPAAAPASSPFASVPRATQELDGVSKSPSPLHTAGIERLSSGFPSPGLGGPRNGKRDMGAFLANRGDA